MQWVCDICGYVHDEDEPTDTCPVCGAPRSKFSEFTEDTDLGADGGEFLEDDDDLDDEDNRY